MNFIYSCIIGNYDQLHDVKLGAGWRAICFTDSDIKSDTWEIQRIEFAPKIFRDIKIRPHVWLPEHKKSVWVDGNLELQVPVNKFAEGKDGFWLMRHPDRNCIYDEAKKCLELGKDGHEVIEHQITNYRELNFPEQYGLSATGCLIRSNTLGNRIFCDHWWHEVKNYSVRDQLSFDFIRWLFREVDEVTINHFHFLENITYHYHIHRMKMKKEKKKKARITKEYYRRYT